MPAERWPQPPARAVWNCVSPPIKGMAIPAEKGVGVSVSGLRYLYRRGIRLSAGDTLPGPKSVGISGLYPYIDYLDRRFLDWLENCRMPLREA